MIRPFPQQTMNYTCRISIQLPREQVVAFYSDPQSMYWRMVGLKSYQLQQGEHGREGAVSHLKFKREHVTENVLKSELPDLHQVEFVAPLVRNIVSHRFTAAGDAWTEYATEQTFVFRGAMKIAGWLMPEFIFRKQTMNYLRNFKAHVERESAREQG